MLVGRQKDKARWARMGVQAKDGELCDIARHHLRKHGAVYIGSMLHLGISEETIWERLQNLQTQGKLPKSFTIYPWATLDSREPPQFEEQKDYWESRIIAVREAKEAKIAWQRQRGVPPELIIPWLNPRELNAALPPG